VSLFTHIFNAIFNIIIKEFIMGLIVNGKWVDQWYDTAKSDGSFVRQDSRFRSQISTEAGSQFTPEVGRYHLYVSLACPWAHRTLIFRQLK